MSTKRWLGGAPAIAQVQSFLFGGTWLANETITVTYGSKTWVYTLASGTIATFLASLAAAYELLSASLYPEYWEQTASSDSTHLLLTADTPGKPFTLTLTASTASGTIDGGTSSSGTTTTANAGPYSWGTSSNWTSNVVPQFLLAPPVQANASVVAGGTLTDTQAYYWVITATNVNGETLVSNEKTLTIAAPNQTAHLSWAAVAGAAGYKVYRGTSAGAENKLLTTITSGSTLTYNDTGGAGTVATLPVSNTALGDDVYVDDPTYPILYDIDQSCLTLTSLHITARFEGTDTTRGTVGLPLINQDATPYPEYRNRKLRVSWANAYIGEGPGSGSGRINLQSGSVSGNLYIYVTDRSPDELMAVMWDGTNAGNTVYAAGGAELGVALLAGETANVSGGLTLGPGATVRCGSGTTIATITNNGGTLEVNGAIGTALVQQGGSTVIKGTGAVAQITASAAAITYSSNGTLGGNTTLDNGSVLNFNQDSRSMTLTNPIVARGSSAVTDSVYKRVSGFVVNSPDGTASVGWGKSWTLTRS